MSNETTTEATKPRKRVYISGAISVSGKPGIVTPEALDNAKAKFFAAAASLTEKGYDVVTPFDNGLSTEAPYEQHLAADLQLLATCNVIYMLPDWRQSLGARVERAVAETNGLSVIDECSPTMEQVIAAIEHVFCMPFHSLCARGKEQVRVYGRMIYVRYALAQGIHPALIGHTINRSRPSVIIMFDKFNYEYKYNRTFADLADSVAEYLAAMKKDEE